MDIDTRIKRHTSFFRNWSIDDNASDKGELGDGNNGKVYRLRRGSGDLIQKCAVKVIPLTEEYGNRNKLSPEEHAIYGRQLFEKTQKVKNEIRTMESLRGNTHIVDYLDHDFDDWSDENHFGRDLYIRMELLTALRKEMDRPFSEKEIIKIGCDICRALMLCHSKGIIHRDIKPDNIFINGDGNYKLGDFGISKNLPDYTSTYVGLSIGSIAYMPAEQLNGRCSKQVDIYSLGLVLYELSNGNKLPFAKSETATNEEIITRLSAKTLPKPVNASNKLATVILKACSFDSKDRYASAEEFLAALENVIPNTPPRGLILPFLLAMVISLVFICHSCTGTIEPPDGPISASEPPTMVTEDVPLQTDPLPASEDIYIEPGTIIEYGAYEQDNDTSNGAEAIEWIVLAQEGNEALVISVLGLETYPYDKSEKTSDWSNCFIREWLNRSFYRTAFSEEEKARIVAKNIIQHKNEDYPGCKQGEDTIDHVFLLSAQEYMTYMHDNSYIDTEYRYGKPSAYTLKKKVDLYNDKYCWWWLRTSSRHNTTACNVTAYGSLDHGSTGIAESGGMIRPAMWIMLS